VRFHPRGARLTGMSIDLRDHFAIHFAAALMRRQHSVQYIVGRAYDLADAMLAERSRRIDAEAAEAMASELPRSIEEELWPTYSHRRLLDDPPPPEDEDSAYEAYLDEVGSGEPEVDPRWLELEMDPSWEIEPRWAVDQGPHDAEQAGADPLDPDEQAAPGVRPGLARTQPQDAAAGEGDPKVEDPAREKSA
jgi:hypothetical protein